MKAIYHVHGSGDYFLETVSQRDATVDARRVAAETGKPASVVMYFDGRMKILHFMPDGSQLRPSF